MNYLDTLDVIHFDIAQNFRSNTIRGISDINQTRNNISYYDVLLCYLYIRGTGFKSEEYESLLQSCVIEMRNICLYNLEKHNNIIL